MANNNSSGLISGLGAEDLLGSEGQRPTLLAERLKVFASRHGLSDDATGELSTLIQEARRLALLPNRLAPPSSFNRPASLPTPRDLEDRDSQLHPVANPPNFSLEDRYQCLEHLGSGGMGDVFRVWDNELGRVMAMKILRRQTSASDAALLRFLGEARVTAQLQHPGIVPLHDVGQLDDSRFYFTMQEVRGRSLSSLIRAVHSTRAEDYWPPTSDGWTLRRTIGAFHRICVAVAYAHDRGIIHRDLKPSNVMIGEYGEVLVMDWGLSRRIRDRSAPWEDPQESSLINTGHITQTQTGRVIGTPAYMPPEQARGEVDRLGPTTDVYALGAVLYHILSGRPPYEGKDAPDILDQVLAGSPPPPGRLSRGLPPSSRPTENSAMSRQSSLAPVPEALRVLCLWAMARNPERRPRDAGVLAEEVLAWLEGEERQRSALEAVAEADTIDAEIRRLRMDADIIEASATAYLSRLPALAPVMQKRQGWKAEDEARALRQRADLLEVQYLQTLQVALNHDPDQEGAHERLAHFYRAQHEESESRGDMHRARVLEPLLKQYDRVGHHVNYLEGHGALTLHTNPPGVHVTAYRYVEVERRLVTQPVGHLGVTPLNRVTLPKGSYLLELHGEGLHTVRYPVSIDRSKHWAGMRPGSSDPLPIPIPRKGALSSGERYVPPGWFWSGGDDDAPGALPRMRIWVDGFVVRRFPVTNLEYLTFLNTLVRSGRIEDALNWAPRERSARPTDLGDLLYRVNAQGRFTLGRDAEGDPWRPDEAVVMIDWASAKAFADIMATTTRLPWRLPYELEWEKAARGADGRGYPWGNFFDPNWACTQSSFVDRPYLPPVDTYPIDESPYGVRGMAGNVCDWCMDPFNPEHAPADETGLARHIMPGTQDETRVFRGGSWLHTPRYTRCAVRTRYSVAGRGGGLSFRLVRPYPS